MVWREQANHVDNCYFCMTVLLAETRQHQVPKPHHADLPPPLFTSLPELVYEPVNSTSEESSLKDDCYEPLADNKSPILFTQSFLNTWFVT